MTISPESIALAALAGCLMLAKLVLWLADRKQEQRPIWTSHPQPRRSYGWAGAMPARAVRRR